MNLHEIKIFKIVTNRLHFQNLQIFVGAAFKQSKANTTNKHNKYITLSTFSCAFHLVLLSLKNLGLSLASSVRDRYCTIVPHKSAVKYPK